MFRPYFCPSTTTCFSRLVWGWQKEARKMSVGQNLRLRKGANLNIQRNIISKYCRIVLQVVVRGGYEAPISKAIPQESTTYSPNCYFFPEVGLLLSPCVLRTALYGSVMVLPWFIIFYPLKNKFRNNHIRWEIINWSCDTICLILVENAANDGARMWQNSMETCPATQRLYQNTFFLQTSFIEATHSMYNYRCWYSQPKQNTWKQICNSNC